MTFRFLDFHYLILNAISLHPLIPYICQIENYPLYIVPFGPVHGIVSLLPV
jgi:hypothetical protein